MIWFISDTHFGHGNIIKYCTRPFQTADEMDAYIMKQWQELIKPGDTVYHLGDVAMYVRGDTAAHVERREWLRQELTGNIKLIQGNHDRVSSGWLQKYLRITSIAPRQCRKTAMGPIHPAVLLPDSEYPILMSHRPLDEKEFQYYERRHDLVIQLNLHGHIHNSAWTLRRELKPKKRAWFNLSVEVHEYRPLSITEINKLAKEIYSE